MSAFFQTFRACLIVGPGNHTRKHKKYDEHDRAHHHGVEWHWNPPRLRSSTRCSCSCLHRSTRPFSIDLVWVDELGQAPSSRKVPFAFAPSRAVIESHTKIAAQRIEGLLILIVPAYLMSARPRQLSIWGSRMRPLPQPPTRSPAVKWGIETPGRVGAIPAVTIRGSGF